MVAKKISVLIIFHNEEKALRKTLDSIYSMDYPKNLIEVVCVDDGSTDKSVETVKNYPVKLLQLKTNKGISCSRNIGLQKCSGDYILFLDAHLYLKNKNTMKTICQLFSKYKNIAGVCGEYATLDKVDKNHIRDIRRNAIFHKTNKERLITLKNFTTWSIAIGAYRRKIFQKTKFPRGFENSYGEDIYLQIQLHNQGYNFLYTPKIYGIHDAKINSKILMRKMIYEINATGNILLKSDTKFAIPFLNYFLSFPLFLILFVIGYLIFSKFFLFLIVFMLFIEITPALKVFQLLNHSFKEKLLTFFYLLTKEFTQGFYLPFYLLTRFKNVSQLAFFLKTFFVWEIQKINRYRRPAGIIA